jgi:hypothetical protein
LWDRVTGVVGMTRSNPEQGNWSALAAFRALMIRSKSFPLTLGKEVTSVMRSELNPLSKAMIGALQDCLLSARPRQANSLN